MAIEFKSIADSMITDTFGSLARPLTMRVADPPILGSRQTYTSETGTGIAPSTISNKFENSAIDSSEFVVITNVNQWTIDPNVADVEINFDANPMILISVKKDADDAAYFLTVRAK